MDGRKKGGREGKGREGRDEGRKEEIKRKRMKGVSGNGYSFSKTEHSQRLKCRESSICESCCRGHVSTGPAQFPDGGNLEIAVIQCREH